MNATSGLHGSNSLTSANLQSLLESRLRARTDLTGSILYRLTWKHRITPLQRQICALRASAARISASAYILSGWPTPQTRAKGGGDHTDPEKVISRMMARHQINLSDRAVLSGWPTTTTRDWKDGMECPNVEINALMGRAVWLAGWPTTTAQDHSRGMGTVRPHDKGIPLPQRAAMANLGTFAIRGKLQSDGSMLIGSCAEILSENQAGAPLNPEHSRWIMRLPAEWASCAPTETRSTRKRRQISAKSSAKSPMIYDL